MRIVGTAGHVDHGKSSLVAALTGTDPDRWAQEQLRGMTLDLGFARLDLGGGLEAGIVDVPGHERFLHNMLAGAAGMDVLLLVVAADEGVMPQTLEHLDVLRFLNVQRTIVVVSKADRLSTEALRAAQEKIATELHGTLAASAPFVVVSSLTGDGLDELRERIAEALRELPPRDPQAPVYLPIDRVFTLGGIGTVVTGTLMQGSIVTGDTLALEPSAKRVRVRSIQVFGTPRESVGPGTRVALNLPGLERHAIARGEVAVTRELAASASALVRFTPLASALALLRRRTPVRAYVGAAEILGTLVFESVPARAQEVEAQLHLREPTVLFGGVRFVARQLSPKTLLGGGVVAGAHARPAAEGVSAVEAAVLAVLRACGLDARDTLAIALTANVREEIAQRALDALAERSEVAVLARPLAYVDAAAANGVLRRALEMLADAHRSEPWALGVTSIALARTLGVAETLLVRILASFVDAGRLANRGGYYATLDHQPRLTAELHALFDSALPTDAAQPLLPVPFAAVAVVVKPSRVAGASKAFDTLVARGALVKIGGDVYRGTQIAEIRACVERYFRSHETMTVGEFRDLIGTSRKYAVPLLEWLDAHGVTLRSGDRRMLRKKTP